MTEESMHASVSCRSCGILLPAPFLDLGMSPLANSYIDGDKLDAMEPFYPLRVYVCPECNLVQLPAPRDVDAVFTDYPYFSSFSQSWLDHARCYAHNMIRRFNLGPQSTVMEVASNDGYLLQYFVEQGIQVLGIDPARTIARTAIEKGIPTEVAFFGTTTARRLLRQHARPALIAANNVVAHVPDLHDFIQGFRELLAPDGVLTIEFPHLAQLVQKNEFDTIYHEHLCYFSLLAIDRVLVDHRLIVFDVEELSTHGGSLRLYIRHAEDTAKEVTAAPDAIRQREARAGLNDLNTYRCFARRVVETKLELLDFFVATKRAGQCVLGYGAPAKGNTLLNYCGIGPELMPFTVDRSPYKQGRFLPGTRIPIRHPDALLADRPDFILILPWNLRDEICEQLLPIRDWGGRFVVPIPTVEIF